jgi:hypothetical protein
MIIMIIMYFFNKVEECFAFLVLLKHAEALRNNKQSKPQTFRNNKQSKPDI